MYTTLQRVLYRPKVAAYVYNMVWSRLNCLRLVAKICNQYKLELCSLCHLLKFSAVAILILLSRNSSRNKIVLIITDLHSEYTGTITTKKLRFIPVANMFLRHRLCHGILPSSFYQTAGSSS